jgi:tetratricopeptide (TPR) repeat protein
MEDKELEAFAFIRKTSLLRKKGAYDEALENASLVYPLLEDAEKDSLKVALYLEMGNIFLAKGDAVSAYRNYNNAFDIAYAIKSIPLQSQAFHSFASLYRNLGDSALVVKNLLASLELNRMVNHRKGLLLDYVGLARITSEKEYIDKSAALADELNEERYRLYSKQMMFAYLMVVQKDRIGALDYLHKNEDLKQSYINSGEQNYFLNIGNIYKYCSYSDSALHYYNLAGIHNPSLFDASTRKGIFKEMAECYVYSGDHSKAIDYFNRSFELSKEQNDFVTASAVTLELSKLYANAGDFRRAYAFNQEHDRYKDTLQKLSSQHKMVLMDVEREKLKHEQDLKDLRIEKKRIKNLQYFGISIAIILLFTLMILIGMFPISKFTIRILNFFAFICLFEFIVLLIDGYLHHRFDEEPLKVWLAKIFIIALLVPIQHFLEHALVHFLESRKLILLRQKMSLKHLWTSMVKPQPAGNKTDIEEGTAVL